MCFCWSHNQVFTSEQRVPWGVLGTCFDNSNGGIIRSRVEPPKILPQAPKYGGLNTFIYQCFSPQSNVITLKEIKIKDINEQQQSQQCFEYVSDRKANGEERNRESRNLNACENVTNEKKSVHAAETQNVGYQESQKAF